MERTQEFAEPAMQMTALPVRPSTLAEATIGGLGLLLIRRFAKRAEYTRSAGLNRLTLGLDAGSTDRF